LQEAKQKALRNALHGSLQQTLPQAFDRAPLDAGPSRIAHFFSGVAIVCRL
jgi:hypothetical protein